MAYGNAPYPDLPSLPTYLSQNPNERRRIRHPEPEPPPREANGDDQHPAGDNQDGGDYSSSKLNPLSLPMLRISNLLFSCDDPERTAFFVPLMILLVVHAMFLLYIHVYAPVVHPEGGEEEGQIPLSWEYLNLRGKRYYDVDGLKSSAA